MSQETYPFPRLRGRLEGLNDYALTYITDETSDTYTLAAAPVAPTMQVFKNGALLDPYASVPDYTVDGKTITLASALLATDALAIYYHFRDGGE